MDYALQTPGTSSGSGVGASSRGIVAGAPTPGSRLFAPLPDAFDLRDTAQLDALLCTADALVDRVASAGELVELEWAMAGAPSDWPLAAHLAVKLARSKCALRRRSEPLHLSVVVAVYAEHQRILAPHAHPHGEGFLDRKLRQLDWLFEGGRNGRYELIVVDDGCPHQSGRIAEAHLRRQHPDAPARVVFLADAIAAGLPGTRPLTCAEDSHKGGAIRYGMHEATRTLRPGQVVLFTDADLSTHLGQAGLLVEALDRPGVIAATGSRRARTSVVVKSGARSDRGQLFIHLWKRMLPEIGYVEDTQCGFKAFSAGAVRGLIEAPIESGFAFDLELLLRAELEAPRSIAPVPIAWIDSEAASTTASLGPYLSMLKSIARLYRTYRGSVAEREEIARAIDALDEPAWQRAVKELAPAVVAEGRLRVEALRALVA